MGVSLGDSEATIGANDENPKGFWERRDVIDLNEALLAESNSTWHSPLRFSLETISAERQGEFVTQANNILSQLPAEKAWAIKDPRLCLSAPFWCKLVERPLIVFVHRDPIEVADSLNHRNGFELSHGLALWEFYSRRALSSLPEIPVVKVSFNGLMEDSSQEIRKLYEGLSAAGVENIVYPKAEETSEFIDEKLYRNRSPESDLSGILTHPQLKLLAAIRSEADQRPEPTNSQACEHALEQHQRSVDEMTKLPLIDSRALITPKARLLAELLELNTSYQNLKVQRSELEEAYGQAKEKIAGLEEAYKRSQEKREELEIAYQKTKKKREEAEAAYSRSQSKRQEVETAYQALKSKRG